MPLHKALPGCSLASLVVPQAPRTLISPAHVYGAEDGLLSGPHLRIADQGHSESCLVVASSNTGLHGTLYLSAHKPLVWRLDGKRGIRPLG